MKKFILLSISIGILFSCNEDDSSNSNTELIGNWKLIEVFVDPGDGLGTFSSVESMKTITFQIDGTIISNGNLCDMSISSDKPTSGTYSKTEFIFNSGDCSNPNNVFTFEKNGNILIIDYSCIEPCLAIYIKE
jgi:hypothetical protein